MGRTASGVKAITLKDDFSPAKDSAGKDVVVAMDILASGEVKNNLLIVMANGYGKRTVLSQFRIQHRGGSGIKAANITAKTGPIVSAKVLREEEELIVISSHGQVIRTKIKSISKLGRATQGVRIMRLAASDKVASVATV